MCGKQGCVPLETLTKHGFCKVGSSTLPKENASDESEEEVTFERTVTTHYVDLQEFVVPEDADLWDVVKKHEVEGHKFAIVMKYQ